MEKTDWCCWLQKRFKSTEKKGSRVSQAEPREAFSLVSDPKRNLMEARTTVLSGIELVD